MSAGPADVSWCEASARADEPTCRAAQIRERVIDTAIAGCCSGMVSCLTVFDVENKPLRNLSYCLLRDADDTVPPA